ncbi:hypothetical protein AB4Z09_06635 [Rhodococcus sp. TAF43]|uniref:hypothetical protein n=1 Tax=unclassified Rhodococcus (in: high G+C Gram-positive bacteria) TaxID=192944 RepID=UPI000E2C41EF|nr:MULTISPECIES: hypothetical protein [unclassified Rhodococcus (in: high G+C Gram-positive bacteria)]RDI25690.1 hypothetical protein DEU38_10934 [Rhodococcus sp. AG1013]
MKLHRTAAVSVLAIAALGVATGTAYAEPGPPPSPGVIHYQTQIGSNGTSLDTVLDAGTFRVAGNVVDVVDPAGATVGTIPLTYPVAGTDISLVPSVDGSRLTLTPAVPAQGVAALHNVDARQDAYDNMVRQIEQGWFNGGQMSAQIGAGVGAVVGCVLFLFVGCIPGAAIGGAIGAATGITNNNPAVQPAVFDFIATLY